MFRFGEQQTDFSLDLNSSQSYFSGNPPISHPSIFNTPDFRFGGGTQPENSFSGRHFGVMAASPFYEGTSEISTESEFSVEDDLIAQIALILASLNVQAHHKLPDCVTSASKKRPSVKCREYL